MNFYADRAHVGWRGNLARAHRAHQAAAARVRRRDARRTREFAAEMAAIIANKGGKK